MPWFTSWSGQKIELSEPPTSWNIRLADIAHALSMICRWAGHSNVFYSVAQHSVLMANEQKDPKLALKCLLHDAAEAYVGDMVSPMKKLPGMETYKKLEDDVHNAIALRFDLPVGFQDEPAVKEADLRMQATEVRQITIERTKEYLDKLPPPYEVQIVSWTPEEARYEFKMAISREWSRLYGLDSFNALWLK